MPNYLSPGVYVEEVSRGSKPIEAVGTAVAGFIGFAPQGPANKPELCTNWEQFTSKFGDFAPGSYLAHAVYGYFNNGGGPCYVSRLSAGNGSEPKAPRATAEIAAAASGEPITLVAKAKQAGSAGEGISIDVADGETETVDVTIRQGTRKETFEGLSFSTKQSAKNVVTEVNAKSKLVTLEEEAIGGASLVERLPAAGTYKLAPAETKPVTVKATSPDIYEGDTAERSGLGGFEAVDEITMVCAPDLMGAFQAGAINREGVKAVQQAMIDHCERMGDRVAILDPLPAMNAQEVKDWRMKEAGYDSKYAALYYPWVKVVDPTPGSEQPTIFVPPSGHLAGVWARSDTERGVHKAPANETIRGVIDLENNTTKGEQDLLNPDGVNCIRAFPGMGIRVWGARTLSSDPEWRYLNVRRLFNNIEESIELGTRWAVFEPNDQRLWAAIDRNVTSFLTTYWRQGALFGNTPQDAFFVKVDAENNPPEERDLGRLHIDIGIAPVKPAEFIIFRISQLSEAGASG